jgi:hypothetical protein
MAPRSKVDQLPEDIRRELEQRLIASGFGDYQGLAGWLAEKGYEIGKSSLHRWGQPFEERLAAVRVATQQAHAIVEATPDSANAVNDALLRLVQERLFNVLMLLQKEPDPATLGKLARAIADLGRASINQKKLAADAKRQAREELLIEQREKLEQVASEQGLSAEQVKFWQRTFLGVPGA